MLDHDSGLIRNLFTPDQLTDFARGVLSDSDSDGIHDTVASPSRTQAWDLDAMGAWQSRTHNAKNQVTGVGSATLAYFSYGSMTTDHLYDSTGRQVLEERRGFRRRAAAIP